MHSCRESVLEAWYMTLGLFGDGGFKLKTYHSRIRLLSLI